MNFCVVTGTQAGPQIWPHSQRFQDASEIQTLASKHPFGAPSGLLAQSVYFPRKAHGGPDAGVHTSEVAVLWAGHGLKGWCLGCTLSTALLKLRLDLLYDFL